MNLLTKQSAVLFLCLTVLAARAVDSLEAGFAQPPAPPQPWCYYYWVSDNISKEGISEKLVAPKEPFQDVAVIAEVSVNGKPAATLWAAPFRADITPYVKAGANQIAVKVTSTWFNRLAYDASLPEAQRKTWTIKGPAKNAPLQPAGLIGPVVVRHGQVVDLP